jgi:hypothetical protein
MPVGILEFNLPEEQREFANAFRGGDMHSSMLEIQGVVRKALKYGEPSIENYRKALEEIREIAAEYE